MIKHLDADAVAAEVGRSVRWCERKRKAGEFPQPDTKDGHKVLWKPETIAAWKASLKPITLPGDGASLKPVGNAKPEVQWTETDQVKVMDFLHETPVVTMEDAVAKAEVDLTTWRVSKMEVSAWQTPMRIRQGQDADKRYRPDVPIRMQMWRVKLYLERILPKPFRDADDLFFERIAAAAPKFKVPAFRLPKDGHLIEIDAFDAHFGKFAWAPETGQNYDLRIAERIYRNAVEDLVGMCSNFPIAQFVFPIGNDFFHVDNQQSATTKGTLVDSDGRYAKIIDVGEAAIISAIDYLLCFAPVKVLWIPGNHDEVASYHLARNVRAWFRNCDRVEVDHSPMKRKYVRYGNNLIGYIHGDKIKSQKLPNIMAQERRQDWGETTNHEWRLGHLHKSMQTLTTAVDTQEGVVIRTLQSLSATDSWHHEMGFVCNRRAAEAYISHHETGYVGHFNALARED